MVTVVIVFSVVVGLVACAARQADERDRSPVFWGGMALAAACGAAFASWHWLVGGVAALGGGSSLVAAGFASIVGPVVAPTIVVLILRGMPPGPPRIGAPVAVRMSGSREKCHLVIGVEGLRLITDEGERLISRGELSQIEADGECLRLALRDGGAELRLQVIEFDDPWRRRRTCWAMAEALIGPPPRATIRRG